MQPTNSSLTNTENTPLIKKAVFTPAFLIFDLLVRFLVHWLFLLNIVGPLLFWLFQLLIIPVFTILLLISAKDREPKWKEYFKKKDNISGEFILTLEDGPQSFLFGFLNFVLGLYISWILFNELFSFWYAILLTFMSFILYGIYVRNIYKNSFARVPEYSCTEQTNDKTEVDENDIELVNLEVAVNGYSQRIDTYTIESALLGALSFSCFMTILGVDPQLPADAKLLIYEMEELLKFILKFDTEGIRNLIRDFKFYTVPNILSVLAFEALLCSLLYLLVIVKRIKYYGHLDNVQKNLQIAKNYNQKEEEYDLLCKQSSDNQEIISRKEELTSKIKVYTNITTENLENLKMVMNYMTFIRESALFIFVLIIATSACIVSFYTGLVFILLYILFQLMHSKLLNSLLAKLDFLKFNKSSVK